MEEVDDVDWFIEVGKPYALPVAVTNVTKRDQYDAKSLCHINPMHALTRSGVLGCSAGNSC